MPKLTDSQLVILSAAAARDDRAVLPFPKSLKLNKGALTAVINSLTKHGLVNEQPANRDQAHWRNVDGQKLMLIITDAGLKAIGFEPNDSPAPDAATSQPPTKAAKAAQRASKLKAAPSPKQSSTKPETKQALLIGLLRRKAGATIAEIIKVTGWQAHSVRGAISGTLKKKLGLVVESKAADDRGRIYRITGRQ